MWNILQLRVNVCVHLMWFELTTGNGAVGNGRKFERSGILTCNRKMRNNEYLCEWVTMPLIAQKNIFQFSFVYFEKKIFYLKIISTILKKKIKCIKKTVHVTYYAGLCLTDHHGLLQIDRKCSNVLRSTLFLFRSLSGRFRDRKLLYMQEIHGGAPC